MKKLDGLTNPPASLPARKATQPQRPSSVWSKITSEPPSVWGGDGQHPILATFTSGQPTPHMVGCDCSGNFGRHSPSLPNYSRLSPFDCHLSQRQRCQQGRESQSAQCGARSRQTPCGARSLVSRRRCEAGRMRWVREAERASSTTWQHASPASLLHRW